MKRIVKLLTPCLFLCLWACQDVIELTVPIEPERLVIEASINWQRNTDGRNQTVKLSTSTPYFDTNTPPIVTGATVQVVNLSSGVVFDFVDQLDGTYSTDAFIPVLNQSYSLEVRYNGEVYMATETMTGVPPIRELSQSTESGFDDEALEVNIFFDDPIEMGNSYLFKFYRQGDLLPELEYFNDEFINGNELSWWYEKEDDEDTDVDEEFEVGDVVEITLYGISPNYYDYIGILIDQYWNDGGPFGVTPVGLKGNCINTTNPDNPAYGFFRLSQIDHRVYTFQ